MKKIVTLLTGSVLAFSIHAQSFTVIENATGALYAKGISSDGKYIVGQTDSIQNGIGSGTDLKSPAAFVWTKEAGVHILNPESVNVYGDGNSGIGVAPTGRIVGVAPDPDRIVNTLDPYQLPFITAAYHDAGAQSWTILPLMTGIATPFYGHGSQAYGITDNGNVIVGGQTPGGQAQRWSAGYWDVTNPAQVVYHSLAANSKDDSKVLAVSGDGKVMGGVENEYPVLWLEGVRTTIPGTADGYVRAISNNGRYVALHNGGGSFRAALYDLQTNKLVKFDLNNTPFSAGYSFPFGVSNDGTVVGNWGKEAMPMVSPPQPDTRKAFIYNKTIGMQPLADVLTQAGVSLQGTTLLVATSISADGKIVTGFGKKSGKFVSFVVELPELPNGTNPVVQITVDSPAYGSAVLSWSAPEKQDGPDAPALTGYKVYNDEHVLLATIEATETSYSLSSLANGVYRYYVVAVYDDEGTVKNAVPSKTVQIVIGKKTLPFYDDFSKYQPGGAVVELREILEEIPLSMGYWDVTADFVSFSNTWKVNQSGYPNWCAGIQIPEGADYSESLITPYFDARNVADLTLMFNVSIPNAPRDTINVEWYDGAAWKSVDKIPGNGIGSYRFKTYSLDEAVGKDNIRVRFRLSGKGSAQAFWLIDNVELVDDANKVTVEKPLVINARVVEDEGSVHVNWSDPNGYVSLRYMWDDNVYIGALNNDKLPFIAANMYPAEDLKDYEGYHLTSISFWRTNNADLQPYIDAGLVEKPVFRWYVSQGGQRLFDAPVTTDNFKWNTIELENPIVIDVTKPLYYGVEVVSSNPQDLPIGTGTFYTLDAYGGTDIAIANGRGNLYSDDYSDAGVTTWRTLVQDERYADLFAIRATLAKDPATGPKPRILGYQVLRNNEKLLDEMLHGNNVLVPLNNFTDLNPLPGEEACYAVKAYYTYQIWSDGITSCVRMSGIDVVKGANGLNVYPNIIRKNEILQVELPGAYEDTNPVIRIYDLSGKQVQEVKVSGKVTPVTMNVDAGVYILKVNGQDATKLIVK